MSSSPPSSVPLLHCLRQVARTVLEAVQVVQVDPMGVGEART